MKKWTVIDCVADYLPKVHIPSSCASQPATSQRASTQLYVIIQIFAWIILWCFGIKYLSIRIVVLSCIIFFLYF